MWRGTILDGEKRFRHKIILFRILADFQGVNMELRWISRPCVKKENL